MALFPGYQDQGTGIDRRCHRIVGGRISKSRAKARRSVEDDPLGPNSGAMTSVSAAIDATSWRRSGRIQAPRRIHHMLAYAIGQDRALVVPK